MLEQRSKGLATIAISLATLVSALAVGAAIASSDAHAVPPLTAAQQFCEHRLGGTFTAGGTHGAFPEQPLIYQCDTLSAGMSDPAKIRPFVNQCENAYRGFATLVPIDTPIPPAWLCAVEPF